MCDSSRRNHDFSPKKGTAQAPFERPFACAPIFCDTLFWRVFRRLTATGVVQRGRECQVEGQIGRVDHSIWCFARQILSETSVGSSSDASIARAFVSQTCLLHSHLLLLQFQCLQLREGEASRGVFAISNHPLALALIVLAEYISANGAPISDSYRSDDSHKGPHGDRRFFSFPGPLVCHQAALTGPMWNTREVL